MNKIKIVEKASRLMRFKADFKRFKQEQPLKHASDNEDDRPQFYSPFFRKVVLTDPLFETYFALTFAGALVYYKGLYNMIPLF